MPGLRVLADGGPLPKVDVVAVHGLNPKGADAKQHAWQTWTAGDKTLWLRDELPKSFPDARIYLYEYDSRVFSNKPTFLTAANELLDHLTGARRKDKAPRPLILIGHNLGGLLIKQALVNAHNNSHYAHIKEATAGLMFFATPHGGKTRENVKANLGLTAASIAGFVGFSNNDSLVEAVSPGSVFEDTLTEAFRHQLEAYTLVSFWGKRDTIVNEASATFGLAGHRECILPLDASHSNICKFDMAVQEDKDNYSTVENNFSWLFEKCIESLTNRNLETRIQALLPAAGRNTKTSSLVR